MINFNQIQNLSEIHSEYECFFIDLWGVIHNGVNLFENVVATGWWVAAYPNRPKIATRRGC